MIKKGKRGRVTAPEAIEKSEQADRQDITCRSRLKKLDSVINEKRKRRPRVNMIAERVLSPFTRTSHAPRGRKLSKVGEFQVRGLR